MFDLGEQYPDQQPSLGFDLLHRYYDTEGFFSRSIPEYITPPRHELLFELVVENPTFNKAVKDASGKYFFEFFDNQNRIILFSPKVKDLIHKCKFLNDMEKPLSSAERAAQWFDSTRFTQKLFGAGPACLIDPTFSWANKSLSRIYYGLDTAVEAAV